MISTVSPKYPATATEDLKSIPLKPRPMWYSRFSQMLSFSSRKTDTKESRLATAMEGYQVAISALHDWLDFERGMCQAMFLRLYRRRTREEFYAVRRAIFERNSDMTYQLRCRILGSPGTFGFYGIMLSSAGQASQWQNQKIHPMLITKANEFEQHSVLGFSAHSFLLSVRQSSHASQKLLELTILQSMVDHDLPPINENIFGPSCPVFSSRHDKDYPDESGFEASIYWQDMLEIELRAELFRTLTFFKIDPEEIADRLPTVRHLRKSSSWFPYKPYHI